MFSKEHILKSDSKKDIERGEFKGKAVSFTKTKNKFSVYMTTA